MSERAVVYEGTMETYKKKLEELSDLKRQVRILEEKNSDYMQHNMELEEVHFFLPLLFEWFKMKASDFL